MILQVFSGESCNCHCGALTFLEINDVDTRLLNTGTSTGATIICRVKLVHWPWKLQSSLTQPERHRVTRRSPLCEHCKSRGVSGNRKPVLWSEWKTVKHLCTLEASSDILPGFPAKILDFSANDWIFPHSHKNTLKNLRYIWSNVSHVGPSPILS